MITLMNLGNLIVLSIQLLATAVVILFIGYICHVIRDVIWCGFRLYPWYKKIAIILITPPVIFAIVWFVVFIWLGPENCHLIM